MSLHYLRELPSLGQIAASKTHSVLLPKGPTYRGLMITLKKAAGTALATAAEIAADVTVRLKINGVVRWTRTAAQIQAINAYNGRTAVNGYLPIIFAEPNRRTLPGFENTAWGTANVDTIQLDVLLGAAGVIDTISAQSLVTPESRELGLILESHTITYSPSGTSIEISDLPRFNGDLVALHLYSTVLTDCDVVINGVDFRDVDKAVADQFMTDLGERTPQTNYLHIDPTAWTDMLDDRWPLGPFIEDFRLKATTSGAGTIDVIMETLSQPLAVRA